MHLRPALRQNNVEGHECRHQSFTESDPRFFQVLTKGPLDDSLWNPCTGNAFQVQRLLLQVRTEE